MKLTLILWAVSAFSQTVGPGSVSVGIGSTGAPPTQAKLQLPTNFSGSGFTPAATNTGGLLTWDFGDGSGVYVGDTPNHTYADASLKTVTITSSNNFAGLTALDLGNSPSVYLGWTGTIPDLRILPALRSFTSRGPYNNGGWTPTQRIGWTSIGPVPPTLTYLYLEDNQLTTGLANLDSNKSIMTDILVSDNNFGNSVSIGAPSFAGYTSLVNLEIERNLFVGPQPTLPNSPNLINLAMDGNLFSNIAVPVSANLQTIYACCNPNISGPIPSFAAKTALTDFEVAGDPGITGTLPSFAANTSLNNFSVNDDNLSATVPGSFATQAAMGLANFGGNGFSAAVVNQILADFVASLGLPGRVHCTVNLGNGITGGGGGPNAAPTGQGLVDKALLIAAGWTVTTN